MQKGEKMQAILFDVDGVLVHGYHHKPEYRVCWDADLEKDTGIKRDVFAQEFIFKDFVEKVVVGKESLQSALDRFLPSVGYKEGSEAFINYWMEKDTNVNEYLLKIVNFIKNKEGIELYIATNQEHNRARHLMEKAGFKYHFKEIFYSGEIGYKKPSEAYFAEVHKRLGSPEKAPIFFDDTPAVVEAAKAFGWKAYTFDTLADLYKDPFVSDLLRGYEGI